MNLKSSLMLVLALGTAGAAFCANLLPSGKAPLKAVSGRALYEGDITFNPETLTYSYGNKRLVLRKNGVFSILSDNRELGNAYFFLATPYQYWMTNQSLTPVNGDFDGKGMRVTEIKTEGKKITFLGKTPWNKKDEPTIAGDWQITVEPVAKSKIKIEWSYVIPEGQKRRDDAVFMSVKHCKLMDAGALGTWIPGTKKNFSSWKPTVLTMEGTLSSDTYRIEASLWTTQTSLRFNSSRGKISATFDFSGSPSATAVKTPGGVDLLASDALVVPERGRNMLPNPYFADKYQFMCSYDTTSADKMVGTDAKFGRYSYIGGGWMRFATVPADAGDYVFSFYAKGKGWATLVVRSGGRGFEKDYSCGVNSPNEWKRYEKTFSFPLNNSISLELRLPKGIIIDGLQLEKGKKATAFEGPAIEASQNGDFFFKQGSDVKLDFELNTLLPKVSGNGTFTIKNFFGEQVYKKDFSYDVSAGKYPKLSFNPGKLPDGIYVANFKYGKTAPEQFFRFSVMPFLKNTHKTARIFSRSYYGHSPLKKSWFEKDLERMQQIGIGCDGHGCLMTKEVLDLFAKYKVIPFDMGFASRTGSENMKKLFPELNVPAGRTWFFVRDARYPSWSPKGLLPDYRLVGGWTPEYRKKFIELIAAQIRQYPQRFAYNFASEWASEIKNDKNYIDLYMAYREAVHSVYPKALVYEAGDCNMDTFGGTVSYDKLLKRMEGRTVTDFAGSHTYVKDIRLLYGNFRAFVDMLSKHKGYEKCKIALPEGMHYYAYNIPAWNFEQVCWMGEGWKGTILSYDLGWSEKISAAYYARGYLVYFTEFDRVWCGTCSAGNVNNFRMDYNNTPRAFQKIPNTLGVLLGNPKKYLGNFTFAPDTMCLAWEDENGRPVAAVWSEDPAVNDGIKNAPMAKLAYRGAEYIDLMGVPRKPEKDGEFAVSPFPLFIRGKAGEAEAFTKALSVAVLDDPDKLPCRIGFNIQSADTIKMSLINPLARNLAGTMEVFGKQYPFDIAKNSTCDLQIKLPTPIKTGTLETIRIPYACKIQGRTIKNELALNCFTIPKFKGDWKKIPTIQLTNFNKGPKPAVKDLSASYQLAWTEKNMLLRVTVKDDVFAPGTMANQYRWNYDVLQVYFDTRCSAMKQGRKAYDDDDYEYGFMPTADGKHCEVWRALSPDIQLTLGIGAPKNNTLAKEIPAKFTRTADGYIYEAEFPADYVLPIRLTAGYNFACGIYVADKDRGKNADKFVTNATAAHEGCYNKPHLWPIAVLTE